MNYYVQSNGFKSSLSEPKSCLVIYSGGSYFKNSTQI